MHLPTLIIYVMAPILLFVNFSSSLQPHSNKIDPALRVRIEDSPTPVNVIIQLKNVDDGNSSRFNNLKFGDSKVLSPTEARNLRCSIIKALKKALVDIHNRSVVNVIAVLIRFLAKYICYYINNTCVIFGITSDLLQVLLLVPEVERIFEEVIFKIPKNLLPETEGTSSCPGCDKLEWGVEKINANLLWKEGVEGEGIVVAILDSGVFAEHDTLKLNMRSNYNWFDPKYKSLTPREYNIVISHGTGAAACAVGRCGVGVARKSKWIACVACPDDIFCPYNIVNTCLEWSLCPKKSDGSEEDCCQAPDVVNMSFYSDPADPPDGKDNADIIRVTEPILKTFRAARIIPVAAIGNYGDVEPYCATTVYPGYSEFVISAGATTITDEIAPFSSSGPGGNLNDGGKTPNRTNTQPFATLPGHQITTSAYRNQPETDKCLRASISGTSFSTPYLAGTVALFLSWNYNFDIDDIRRYISKSAFRPPTYIPNDDQYPKCKDEKFMNGDYPNNIFGFGRVDALAAYKLALLDYPELSA